MGNPSQFGDPRIEMRLALREIREALHALREGVVTAVMHRNRAQDDVVRLERSLADLDTKADLADRIRNASLAGELREERARRAAELEEARKLAASLAAAAENAKLNLPEEEARLLQKARDLQSMVSSVLDQFHPGILDSAVDDLFERARNKTRDLQNEASARGEVAGVRGGEPYTPLPPDLPASLVSREESAEQMLAALEARIGSSPIISQSASVDADRSSPAAQVARPLTSAKGDAASMNPTQRVRVAAIGAGNIFRGAHLPTYPEIAQAQLVALCDPDPVAQQAALKRYHELMEAKHAQAKERGDDAAAERIERDRGTIQVCADISEVIEKIKPDLVDICTQPFLHAPLSIQALEAGLNVMCEKPISRSWLESQRLIEAVGRTGKLYQHNENWLWDPDWYTAKKLVDAGAIGEPILMFLATAHGGPEGAAKFWNSDFGGGGALLDNGIHAIGASWYVSGLDQRPTYVKAAQPFGMSIRMPNRILDGRFQKVTVDDDAHILIRFENPNTLEWTTAHVEGSWSHRDSPDTAVIGTTGRIVFVSEESRRYAVVYDAYDRESRRIQVSGPTWQPWPSSFYGEILNMVESVRNGVPSISDAAFGAECSAIVGAAYLSERDNRRAVSVDEFKTFARGFAERYPDDPAAADNALVDALLAAVRK